MLGFMVALVTPGVGDGQGGLACCGSWGHVKKKKNLKIKWKKKNLYRA